MPFSIDLWQSSSKLMARSTHCWRALLAMLCSRRTSAAAIREGNLLRIPARTPPRAASIMRLVRNAREADVLYKPYRGQ